MQSTPDNQMDSQSTLIESVIRAVVGFSVGIAVVVITVAIFVIMLYIHLRKSPKTGAGNNTPSATLHNEMASHEWVQTSSGHDSPIAVRY